MISSKNGENGHPGLVPDLGEKPSSLTLYSRGFEHLSAISVSSANSEALPMTLTAVP